MFNWLKKNPQPENIKTLGQIGEELAQEEYKKQGYEVVAANFFNRKGLRLGEIDFIAKNGSKIIFVEVKTRSRSGGKFGSAQEAVNSSKQRKILKAVKIFLQNRQEYQRLQPQIDVCVMEIEKIDKLRYCATIIPNAVEDWD